MTSAPQDVCTPKNLVLIRHGETPWAAAGKHTGRSDIALSDAGKSAAGELAGPLSRKGITICYSSPLSRALDTANLAGFGAPMLLDDLLEWNYGTYEGLTTPEIQEIRPGWSLWRDGCPEGENSGDVGKRADHVIELITSSSAPDDVVAVFGHGHMLRVLAARWMGHDPSEGRRLMLSVATVSELSYEHADRAVRMWNAGVI